MHWPAVAAIVGWLGVCGFGPPPVGPGRCATTQPAVGVIAGTIVPGSKLKGIQAIHRPSGRTYPGWFDAKSGRFRIEGLAPARRYDLIVETTMGRFEGVDLAVLPPDLLAGPDRCPASSPAGPFTQQDRSAVRALIEGVRQFEDQVRILQLRGSGDRAVALIEKVRSRRFHSARGPEVLWRIELWYFRKWYGGWARIGHVERVLHRLRLGRDEFRALRWVFVDALGGIELDRSGRSRPVHYTLPDKLDAKLGRAPSP